MIQSVTSKSQIPTQLIHKDIGPEVTDVVEIINRGSAVVDPHSLRVSGLKGLFLSSE